ncbi:hypothetical protein PR202_ga12243 [Eleusine coracana subsp. coracana]|uniref:Uncharacterized protein n=1 Tax=Eleusine coracana subsp. coracana TaxID=191504 RepID=A0AAV5CBK3_ELECO|nr:hypothetical protein PR202_ga12243 [Eleusine coracana subsp. coracana]
MRLRHQSVDVQMIYLTVAPLIRLILTLVLSTSQKIGECCPRMETNLFLVSITRRPLSVARW